MCNLNGPILINNIEGGAVNFGDAFYISPNSSSKTNAGAGGFNTGDFIRTKTGVSITKTKDPDVSDQQTVDTA